MRNYGSLSFSLNHHRHTPFNAQTCSGLAFGARFVSINADGKLMSLLMSNVMSPASQCRLGRMIFSH